MSWAASPARAPLPPYIETFALGRPGGHVCGQERRPPHHIFTACHHSPVSGGAVVVLDEAAEALRTADLACAGTFTVLDPLVPEMPLPYFASPSALPPPTTERRTGSISHSRSLWGATFQGNSEAGPEASERLRRRARNERSEATSSSRVTSTRSCAARLCSG